MLCRVRDRTLLSAVAALTRKAELGTAVLLPARRAAAEPAPSGKPGTDARSAENGGRKAASKRSDILLVVGSRRAICESRDRAGGSIQQEDDLVPTASPNSMDRPRDCRVRRHCRLYLRAAAAGAARQDELPAGRHCRAVRVDHGAHGRSHAEGGMVFPHFEIDELKKQEARDLT